MRFEYCEAKSIPETVSLLRKYNGKAKIIAGGTDLLPQIRNKVISPRYVIDIEGIPGISHIKLDKNSGLSIGAMTSIRDLEKSSELQRSFPVISRAAGTIGSVAVRNVATIGGNLCNAAPSADTAPALIGLSARVRIAGHDGERIVPLESFFTGPGTNVLEKGEVLMEIQVPPPEKNTKATYLKHSYRGAIDLAILGVAVVACFEPDSKTCKDIKVVLGAAAPTPIRARKCEDLIRGKDINEKLINESAAAAADEAHPRSTSYRASVEYRKEMIKVFVKRALWDVISQSIDRDVSVSRGQ